MIPDSLRSFLCSRILFFLIVIREYKNWPEILIEAARHHRTKDIIIRLRKYNLRFKTHTVGGLMFSLFYDIFIKDCYSVKQFNLKPDSCIVDIGSNIGMFILFVKVNCENGRFIACEPLRENFNLLQENMALNGIDNCSCHNLAIMANSGKAQFIPGKTMALGRVDFTAVPNKRSLMVNCLSLEDLFAIDRIEHCDLLKMDCEGSECDILFNAKDKILQRVANIAVEIHGDKAAFKRMESYLASKGYAVNSAGNYLFAQKLSDEKTNSS